MVRNKCCFCGGLSSVSTRAKPPIAILVSPSQDRVAMYAKITHVESGCRWHFAPPGCLQQVVSDAKQHLTWTMCMTSDADSFYAEICMMCL